MQLKLRVGLICSAIALALGLTSPEASAQRPGAVSPSVEIAYVYTHANAPVGSCGCFGLNGGSAAFVAPLHSSPIALMGGFSAASAGNIGAAGYDLTLFTYTAGVRYSPRFNYRILYPYAEVQAGGAHLGGSYATAGHLGSAFAGSVGGGLDVRLSHRFSVKLVQGEYLVTTFSNGSNDHQNDLRLSAGVVVSLHR